MNKDFIRHLITLLDLTSLNSDDTNETIGNLCVNAMTPFAKVAAVCIYPQFLAYAKHTLADMQASDIALATVVNFPEAKGSADSVCQEIDFALENGAQEIDLVFPYPALFAGDNAFCEQFLHRAFQAIQGQAKLKVILESGAFESPDLLRTACKMSIAHGADFLKTSTGKIAVGATPEAIRLFCEVIAKENVQSHVGVKAAGGVRTLAQAEQFYQIIESFFGKEWMSNQRVRFGASALLDELLAHLGASTAQE